MYEICSKLTIKTLELRQWRCSDVSTVNFEHISFFFLVYLSLLWIRKSLIQLFLCTFEIPYKSFFPYFSKYPNHEEKLVLGIKSRETYFVSSLVVMTKNHAAGADKITKRITSGVCFTFCRNQFEFRITKLLIRPHKAT